MTALVLHWIERMAGQPHAQTNVHTGHGACPMNSMIFGMMPCIAAIAWEFMSIPDGPLTLQQQFFFGVIVGAVGTIVGGMTEDFPSTKVLCRRVTLNLFLASICAPAVCMAIPVATTVAVIAPVAGLLGLGASVPYKKIWPYLSKAIEVRAKKEIKTFIGPGPDDSNG